MWAGAEFEFFHPLLTGVPTRKDSKVVDMVFKEGSRDEMVFVTWEYSYEQQGRRALVERLRSVFLGASNDSANARAQAARSPVRQKQ